MISGTVSSFAEAGFTGVDGLCLGAAVWAEEFGQNAEMASAEASKAE
jgi:hypothetical protein